MNLFKKSSIFHFSAVLLLLALPVSARLSVDRAARELIMVDGIVYVKDQVAGMFLIGGVWVSPTGNRAFYGENRLPSTPEEWAQLAADVSLGGTGVTDFLNDNFDAIMDSPNAADIVNAVNQGLLDGTGLLSTTAQDWLEDAFVSLLDTDGNTRSAFNFSGLDLDGYDLTGADLRNLGLSGSQLSGSGSLAGADLSGLNLQGFIAGDRDFTGTVLQDTDLTYSDWQGVVDFSGVDFTGANLSGANFLSRDLSGSTLVGANLVGSNFIGATSSTDTGGSFGGAYLRGSSIANVNQGNTPDGNFVDDWVPLGPAGFILLRGSWVLVDDNVRLPVEDSDGNVIGEACYFKYSRQIWWVPEVVGPNYDPILDPLDVAGDPEVNIGHVEVDCVTKCKKRRLDTPGPLPGA